MFTARHVGSYKSIHRPRDKPREYADSPSHGNVLYVMDPECYTAHRLHKRQSKHA